MRFLLLMMVALSGCVSQIFSSEKNDKEVVFLATIPENNFKLHYFLFEHSEFYREGMQKYNFYANSKDFNLTLQQSSEPSVRVEYTCNFSKSDYYCACLYIPDFQLENTLPLWVKYTSDVCRFFQAYTPLVPLHYILSENDGQKFKKKGDELFSFTRDCAGEKVKFIVTLDSDITQSLEDIIKKFREWPSTFGNEEEVKQQLLDQKIICKDDRGLFIHGLESYFGDAVIKEKEEREAKSRESQERLEKLKKSDLFYSQIFRKLFWGGSLAIFMYVLYQKFYATAG